MSWVIEQEHLERLKADAKLNKDGLSNFKLIENKDDTDHFIFRVVCEKQDVNVGEGVA